MVYNWMSFIFLLATLSYVPVREVASVRPQNVPLSLFGQKARRQTTGSESPAPVTMSPRLISPCPGILGDTNIRRGSDRWNGLITLTPDEATTGVVLRIQLDKAADLVGTSYGEVSTDDNIIHTITNDDMVLEPGQTFTVRFFVKYDRESTDPPRVKTITFNGKQICSAKEGPTPETNPPPPTTPRTTSSIPLSPATTASLKVETQPGRISVIPPTVTAISSTRRRPPSLPREQGKSAQLYEINGEIKIRSNASLLVLLIARPPQRDEISNESQTESLDDLLAEVFNVPGEIDEFNAPGSTKTRVLDVLGSGEIEDGLEDEPPFTSNQEAPAAPSGVQQPGTAAPPAPVPTARVPGEAGGDFGQGAGPAQWPSLCPGVFQYTADSSSTGMWYGRLTLIAAEHIVGIRLDIELDKPSRALGAWLGEAKSVDNVQYTIWNSSADILAGETINVRIFAKYDREEIDPPRIRTIRLNGRQICPTS